MKILKDLISILFAVLAAHIFTGLPASSMMEVFQWSGFCSKSSIWLFVFLISFALIATSIRKVVTFYSGIQMLIASAWTFFGSFSYGSFSYLLFMALATFIPITVLCAKTRAPKLWWLPSAIIVIVSVILVNECQGPNYAGVRY